jgi:hypothetical protein
MQQTVQMSVASIIITKTKIRENRQAERYCPTTMSKNEGRIIYICTSPHRVCHDEACVHAARVVGAYNRDP